MGSARRSAFQVVSMVSDGRVARVFDKRVMLDHGGRHEQRLPHGARPPVRSFAPKHCWVLNPPGAPGRWPGLLLEWQRTPTGGWEGRVAYVPHLQNGHALVELWLSAQHLHATH